MQQMKGKEFWTGLILSSRGEHQIIFKPRRSLYIFITYPPHHKWQSEYVENQSGQRKRVFVKHRRDGNCILSVWVRPVICFLLSNSRWGSGTKNKRGDILSDFQFLLLSIKSVITSVNELGDADGHTFSFKNMVKKLRHKRNNGEYKMKNKRGAETGNQKTHESKF